MFITKSIWLWFREVTGGGKWASQDIREPVTGKWDPWPGPGGVKGEKLPNPICICDRMDVDTEREMLSRIIPKFWA